MITKDELDLILQQREGYTIEFKENSNSDIPKELVAFANSSGGRIFKGEHQIRYYGFYSNKKRGMRAKKNMPKNESLPDLPQEGTSFVKKCKMNWAALIKCVYEVLH